MDQTGGNITQLLYPLVGITLRGILHERIDSPGITKPKLLSVATAHEHSLGWPLLAAALPLSHSYLWFPRSLLKLLLSRPGLGVCY